MPGIDRIEDCPPVVAGCIMGLRAAILQSPECANWIGAQITLDRLRDPVIDWTLDVKYIPEKDSTIE